MSYLAGIGFIAMTSAVAAAIITSLPTVWYVLRDLKRANALQPAYKMLGEAGFHVFTPMVTTVTPAKGRRPAVRTTRPFLPDLLFVDSQREQLDPVVDRTPTLQYRYLRGGAYCEPMTVPDREMERFIAAIETVDTPVYYRPDELTPDMLGHRVRIVCCGPLNGYECRLMSVRGSRRRRILIELPNLLTASIEVAPDFFELID